MASDLTIEELARRIAGVDYVAEGDRLRDIFRMSQLLILDSVERLVRSRPDRMPDQLMGLLTDVTRRYRQATMGAQRWANLQTKKAFDAGRKAAVEQLELQGVRGPAVVASFTQVNTRAVEAIAKDTMGDLLRATHLTEERVKQRVREVFMEETRSMVATGVRGSDRAKDFARRFADEQIFGVTAKNGRFIPMDEYARVVANVKLRQAHTEGTEQAVLAAGKDLVQVTTHLHRPDSCSPLEGKVYSLTGRTPGYPRLEKHTPFHPGCRHVETPFIETFRSDAELARIREESNRPGQITVYSQDALDGLEAKQKKRARFMSAKRVLRKQDQADIVSGKKDAPKDAAAYERSLTARANAKVRKMGPAPRRTQNSPEQLGHPSPKESLRAMPPIDERSRVIRGLEESGRIRYTQDAFALSKPEYALDVPRHRQTDAAVRDATREALSVFPPSLLKQIDQGQFHVTIEPSRDVEKRPGFVVPLEGFYDARDHRARVAVHNVMGKPGILVEETGHLLDHALGGGGSSRFSHGTTSSSNPEVQELATSILSMWESTPLRKSHPELFQGDRDNPREFLANIGVRGWALRPEWLAHNDPSLYDVMGRKFMNEDWWSSRL